MICPTCNGTGRVRDVIATVDDLKRAMLQLEPPRDIYEGEGGGFFLTRAGEPRQVPQQVLDEALRRGLIEPKYQIPGEDPGASWCLMGYAIREWPTKRLRRVEAANG